jgi:general secretion pathway protein D
MNRFRHSLTALLISATPLFSQNEEVPVIPGIVQPAGPNPVPAPQPANANLGDTLIVEEIAYSPITGNDLADLYREYTGRRVIVSSAAAVAEFEFNQPASKENPLTYAKAAELLRKAATIENFVFVPDEHDPTLDILTHTSGLRPTGRGVNVYTEKDPLPEGDAVISYVMTLNFIKPAEAVSTFTEIVGQFGAFGSISAVPNTASVIITENTSLIRKLIQIKDQIDKPATEIDTRFFDVAFADVTELADTLIELVGEQQDENSPAGIQRTPTQQADPNNVAVPGTTPGSSAASEPTPIKIIPDARTNRIFAMGRPVDLLFIQGLISKFDTEPDQRNFLTRKLKFLAVSEFLPIAGDALTRAFSGTGTAGAGGDTGITGGTNTPVSNNQTRSNTNRSQTNSGLFNSSNSQSGGSFGRNSGGGGSSGVSLLSEPEVNTAPQSLLIGRTLLVADNITNTIVVQGSPASVEIIEKLLDQIDVRADQVMISTVFGQLTLGDSTSTGVDWLRSFRGNDDGGLAFSNITDGPVNSVSPNSLTNPITGTVAGTFPNRNGLSLYGTIGNSIGAYVNLLSSSTDFTVLARPSIYTANNKLGTISSGRRIAIPTNSNQFSGSGVSTNIEYRDVVLKLEVIPLINSPDEITLKIGLVSDDVIGESDPIEGIGSVPIIGTRQLVTTVTVPNNQTIILGGLITTNDTESVTGIPILSDIPGLGRLFSTKTNGVDRDELMIFIQPSIVGSSNSLNNVQADMNSRYEVSQDARSFADGSVLPPRETTDNAIPASTSNPPTDTHATKRKNIRPLSK